MRPIKSIHTKQLIIRAQLSRPMFEANGLMIKSKQQQRLKVGGGDRSRKKKKKKKGENGETVGNYGRVFQEKG